jgi:hypothetical protein
MQKSIMSAMRRATSAIVIFSVTGFIFSVNWYDMMSARWAPPSLFPRLPPAPRTWFNQVV